MNQALYAHMNNKRKMKKKRETPELHVYCSTILNKQDAESTKVSTGEFVKNVNRIYLHNGILLSQKNE
jgi:hypothetical protein